MINIAVADDEQDQVDLLTEYFHTIEKELDLPLMVTGYSNGDDLLEDEKHTYDLICLDIEMPGSDGMNVARHIRDKDPSVTLIFITNLAQMAIQGYSVQAADFLVKPVGYPVFRLKMISLLQGISARNTKKIIINTADGMHIFTSDALLYAEVRGHYLYYHTTDGTFQQKASITSLEQKLQGLPFSRCNQCYLVNLEHVKNLGKGEVQIGEEWLKISRPRKKAFEDDLTNYYAGGIVC